MEIKIDIVDYMGKMDGGILVLLSVNCDGSEEIEKKIGTKIELWSGYKVLIESVLKKLIPCEELLTRMDDVDFSKYLDYDGETTFITDEIDPEDIETKE